jgi:hypothetical protein
MRLSLFLVMLAFPSLCTAADLTDLPPNTWVEIKYTTEQPPGANEKGRFAPQGAGRAGGKRNGSACRIRDGR